MPDEPLIPGSDPAIDEGCTCGEQDQPEAAEGLYVIAGDCPLHGLGAGEEPVVVTVSYDDLVARPEKPDGDCPYCAGQGCAACNYGGRS